MKNKIILLSFAAVVLTGCQYVNFDSSNDESTSSESTSSDDTSSVIPQENLYYLPDHISEYNSVEDRVVEDISYVYDDDLLGYTKTRVVDYVDYMRKEIDTFRFSADFKSYHEVYEDYDYYKGAFVLDRKQIFDYEFLEYGSYKYVQYTYDPYIEQTYFEKEVLRQYNELGQLVLEYTKRAIDEECSYYYYSSYFAYEYDSEGYATKVSSYDYKDYECTEFYVDYYDVTTYDSTHSSAIEEEFVFDEEKNDYVREGWVDITITLEDGIRVFDEQIYYEDGTKGNHNVFGYDEDFFVVFYNLGDGREIQSLSYNEYGQIIKYNCEDTSFSYTNFELNVTYAPNGGLIIGSTFEDKNSSGIRTAATSYAYNDNNQIVKATIDIEYQGLESSDNEYYKLETTVLYTKMQNDLLNEKMDYYEDIVSSYSHYILNEGEAIW